MNDEISRIFVLGIIRQDDSILIYEKNVNRFVIPGGEIEKGEEPLIAITRILENNFNIVVNKAVSWISYDYIQENKKLKFLIFRVLSWLIKPIPMKHKNLKWFFYNSKKFEDMVTVFEHMPVFEHIISCTKIPDTYAISSIKSPDNFNFFMAKLELALKSGLRLVQFREPDWQYDGIILFKILLDLIKLCHLHNAKVIVNSIHPISWSEIADGLQIKSLDIDYYLHNKTFYLKNKLLGVSAHCRSDILKANLLKANFIVLGSVLKTNTHPNSKYLGWKNFSKIVYGTKLPVFAIGGQTQKLKPIAMEHGAHGIAGISALI